MFASFAMTEISAPLKRVALLAALSLAIVAPSGIFHPAAAQRLVATANSAPITDYDVKQRMRLLRALRMKSNHAAALESLIEQALKAADSKKYSVQTNEQQILAYAARDAGKRKIPQQRLAYALQRGGIDKIHWQNYYKAQLSWDTVIAALYKAVNVSTAEVDEELARRGSKTSKAEYVLQQVTFIIPRGAGAGSVNDRMREAHGLRTRFRNCAEGARLARGLRDVAVRKAVVRRAAQLNARILKIINSTPVGQLTRPTRGVEGIDMLAVCSKKDRSGRVAAGQNIQSELREKKLKVHSERRYKEMRSRALIIRR